MKHVPRQQQDEPPLCLVTFLPKRNCQMFLYFYGNIMGFHSLRKIHLYSRDFVIQIFYTSRDVPKNSSLLSATMQCTSMSLSLHK
jgi:hypothetical protein